MECPRCGAYIDKNTLVCQNCKKVLKLVCHVCKTINTKNVCKKCGEILVTKCAKCGKINQTKNKECVKCGYSTEMSAIIGESNTDNFAVLRIDFPNSDVIKAKLGSNQLFQKFKLNLDSLIYTYVESLNVRRQIINNDVYVIRFDKDYTMSSSANSAILATIELINIITKLNVKLLKKIGASLKCNFTIMQRSTEQNPYDIDTRFHANMVYQSTISKELRALDAFQVVTDESFYDFYNGRYKLDTLNSTLINGSMKRFFEINLKEFVNIGDILKNEALNDKDANSDIEIPKFVQNALIDSEKITKDTIEKENELTDDQVYDIEMIKFEEINCSFIKVESINVLDCVVDVLQKVPRGIVALKASPMYQPYTLKLLSAAEETGIYNNVIPVTCHDDMKYTPYSFFRDLVSSIFEYTISQKYFESNDFTAFANIDKLGLMKDLICLNQRDMNDNFEEIREEYCQMFLSLLQAIPNSLIYIENFEKIDESSLFVLENLFEYFEDLDISYLISYDRDFSLHKKCHFLLSRPFYTEITIAPTPFEVIVGADMNFYKNVLTDFYFQRIAKYACGSTLFLDFAIQYLLESEVYEYSEDSIIMVNPKTIIIPSGLDKIIKRRLNLLKDNQDTIRFLTEIVLLGTRIDEKTLESLRIKDWRKIAEKLAGMGYLYTYNNCIYFPNYSILREGLLEVIKPEDLKVVAQDLFKKVFVESMPAAIKSYLYDLSEQGEKVIYEWEKLANISLSMGDFSSYLNCSTEILKYLQKYSSNWSQEDLMKYQSTLYENVSNNMYEYNPETTRELAECAIANLQVSGQKESYINLATKMIHGAMANGEYMYAMNLAHGVLSSMDNSSIDPAAENFNLYFLLMSITYVKILFNIGAYEDCLDIGYNILNVLDDEKIENIQYSIVNKDEFKFLVAECIGYIALVDVLTMKEDVGEFLEITNKLISFVPKSYSIFIELQHLIKGQTVSLNPQMVGDDMFSGIVYYIINSFINCKDNPNHFAQEIYKAKLIAKEAYMTQLELFADLMIAQAYVDLNSFKKATAILYKIINFAKDKGLNSIVHIAWYILSNLHLKEGKYDIAYGILNNSNIQIEKNGIISEYLTMLNKINMYKVLMRMKSQEQAQICLNQAASIVQRYQLNFNLNIDIDNIMLENSSMGSGLNNPVPQPLNYPTEQEENVSEQGINPDDLSVIYPENDDNGNSAEMFTDMN